MIKMVASDLDGTAAYRWKTDAAGRDFSAGKGTEKNGNLFVAASGRQYANMRNLFAPG